MLLNFLFTLILIASKDCFSVDDQPQRGLMTVEQFLERSNVCQKDKVLISKDPSARVAIDKNSLGQFKYVLLYANDTKRIIFVPFDWTKLANQGQNKELATDSCQIEKEPASEEKPFKQEVLVEGQLGQESASPVQEPVAQISTANAQAILEAATIDESKELERKDQRPAKKPVHKICIDEYLPTKRLELFLTTFVTFLELNLSLMVFLQLHRNGEAALISSLLALIPMWKISRRLIEKTGRSKHFTKRFLDLLFINTVSENGKTYLLVQNITSLFFLLNPRKHTQVLSPDTKIVFTSKLPWAQKYCQEMTLEFQKIQEKGCNSVTGKELIK